MKLNRKWILVLSLVLSVAMATGGTLAYLSDSEFKTNTFTLGGVDITLDETFEDKSVLAPGAEVKKEATITNSGSIPAYVWMTIDMPEGLEEIVDLEWDSKVILHGEPVKADGKTTYTALYPEVLAKGAATTTMLKSVTMQNRSDISFTDGKLTYKDSTGATKEIQLTKDSNTDTYTLDMVVYAYGIQEAGFNTVQEAYEGYHAPQPDSIVKNQEDLEKALENAVNGDVIQLADGTYHMTSDAQGKTLTFMGSHNAIIEVVPGGQGEAGGQLDYSFDGSTVTFNGVTIRTNSQLYAGYARLNGTYNDCVIQNTYNLSTGTSVFNKCTFNITNEYLRVGGASNAAFNECTFNTDGRAILVYQDGTNVAQTVTVKDCTFNATAAANTWNGIHVAAVSIDGSQGGTYVVNLEGTNTVDSDFNGLWQIKAGEANVTVNE